MATKFKRKWMMLHQEEESANSAHLDDSLTTLQWLQGFSVPIVNPDSCPGSRYHPQHLLHAQFQGTDSETTPAAATATPQGSGCLASSTVSGSPSSNSCSPQQEESPEDHHHYTGTSSFNKVDYKTNAIVKPPFSYATLICMAMQASKKTKLTLAAIYNWITENFCYYKHADPSWQNSIRHNLSLNKCFMKVPRHRDEPGKGGFWQLDPQYEDMFVNGIFRRSRQRARPNILKQSKVLQNPQKFQQTQYGDDQHSKVQYARRCKQGHSEDGQNWVQSSPSLLQEIRKSSDIWASDACDENRWRQAVDELELSAALHSLSKEMEDSQPSWHMAGHGNWSVVGPEMTPRYTEVNPIGPTDGSGTYQQQAHSMQLSVTPPQDYEELTLFSNQQLYPWDCLREEAQAVSVSVDNRVSICDGFFYDMQSWDRIEPYLHA